MLLLFVVVLFIGGRQLIAFDVPCTQKLIGSQCLFDEECYGLNTICRDRRCTCPTNFEEFDIDERTTICRPAPSAIGASCQRDCQPPLLCRDGKCECWGGNVVDGRCTVSCAIGQQLYGVECAKVAKWGQPCEKDAQCIEPFNDCIIGMCTCSPGTIRQMTGQCTAVCPDGQQPQQMCKRLFINDIDMLDNRASTDSCPLGFRCVTYGSPYIGHCCRLRCPYGEHDPTQSCDSGAPRDQQCRPLTHYCHTVSEPGWKSSLCCPRPCRDPTPLYINDRCMAIAHRDDPCQTDQQCEGGVAMQCLLGVCQCRLGFTSTNDDRFPTCVKVCTKVDEVAVIDKCMEKVKLGERCIRTKQCPPLAECRFGTCQCLCGYKQSSFITDQCTNPDDPLSLNTILSSVEGIFGRNHETKIDGAL